MKRILILLLTPLLLIVVNFRIGDIVIGMDLPCACMTSRDLILIDINNIRNVLEESEYNLETISYESLVNTIDKEGLELSYSVYRFPAERKIVKSGIYYKKNQDGFSVLKGYVRASEISDMHLILFGFNILPLPFQNKRSVVVPIDTENVEFSYV